MIINRLNRYIITSTLIIIICLITLTVNISAKTYKKTHGKYTYEYVDNDPLNTRIYTLENGLKVYMSVNVNEPRIQTYIVVKAGSKFDPQENTGLAHYLEHMIFKGTDKMGTTNWEKEKVLLNDIARLYEFYRKASNPSVKKKLFADIDSVSYLASAYAIPNEYDKIASLLGAQGTNAYTSFEKTVYMNTIPANELKKWLMLESERFSQLVLRLFHTELETVYEEFNMRTQDDDNNKVYKELLSSLFKKHPYGTQTTIGEAEHLKNPSMFKIYQFFKDHYVPNNMAICLSGNFKPAETIQLVDQYFGEFKSKNIPSFTYEPESPIEFAINKSVYGSQKESISIGFRFDGAGSKDVLILRLINAILQNGQVGLFDLDLLQKQKLLNIYSSVNVLQDYSFQIIKAIPRENQVLGEVKKLILNELNKLKQGEFEDWLIEAVVNNMQLKRMKQFENNNARAHAFVNAFTLDLNWEDVITDLEEMRKITKQQIMAFASKHYKNNYVVVYKKTGDNPDRIVLTKPSITPIKVNRDKSSDFYKDVLNVKSPQQLAVFIDYNEKIGSYKLKTNVEFDYIKDTINELFELYYILDMGTDNDKKFGLAIQYLPYLGTNKYTAKELKQAFFKLGLRFDVSVTNRKTYISLKGLGSSLEKGVLLLEHILAKAKPDETTLYNLVQRMLKKREDAKLNKSIILQGAMINYAKYGHESPFTNVIPEIELVAIEPNDLTNYIHELSFYPHRIFYYGSMEQKAVLKILDKYHKNSPKYDYPPAVIYTERDINKNRVYFVPYDMVQTEFMLVSKGNLYNVETEPYAKVYNKYFGKGLSSIVFQDIREKRGLVYSAYVNHSIPLYKDKSYYTIAYGGTQADKFKEAVSVMKELINELPYVEEQFNVAKQSIMKNIESSRISRTNIFWSYEVLKQKGLDFDIRMPIYEKTGIINFKDLEKFHQEAIKNKNYTILVLGKSENVDEGFLRSLGTYNKLSLDDIFGY